MGSSVSSTESKIIFPVSFWFVSTSNYKPSMTNNRYAIEKVNEIGAGFS